MDLKLISEKAHGGQAELVGRVSCDDGDGGFA
jgi:hypothetical protein